MGEFNLPPGVTSSMIPGNRPEDEECQHGYLLGLDCPECNIIAMEADQDILQELATDVNCPPGTGYIFDAKDQEPLARPAKAKPKVQLDRKGRILPKHKRKRVKPVLSPEQAAKRDRNLEKAQANRPVDVTLNQAHTRNGIVYGPGTGKLPPSLAYELLAEEQAHRANEERFYGTKSAIIGPRDKKGQIKVIDVSPETFSSPLEDTGVFNDRIKGSAFGPDTGEGGKF